MKNVPEKIETNSSILNFFHKTEKSSSILKKVHWIWEKFIEFEKEVRRIEKSSSNLKIIDELFFIELKIVHWNRKKFIEF